MPSVLHVIDTTGPGGAEAVFVELADRLRVHGFDAVTTLRGVGWVRDSLLERGLDPVLIDARGAFNWPYLKRLVALVKGRKIDLIHSHLLGSNVYCSIVGLITGTPVIATFHGLVDVNRESRLRRTKFWLMQRAVYRYVAVSESLAQAISGAGFLDLKRTTVIYNGASMERFGAPHHRRWVRRLGLRDDAILIGSLGNVRPAKAYDVLIEAAARVCEADPRAHFVIAGHINEEVMKPLRRIMEQRELGKRVFFLGFQADTAEFLTGMDIFALSSTSEGFSISTVEGQAAGLPVVATRSGGPEEIIEHERTGLLVPVGSPDALAGALRRLISDRAFAKVLAIEGQRAAAARFSVEAMVSAYRGLYEAAIR